jgi:hypothetical protein
VQEQFISVLVWSLSFDGLSILVAAVGVYKPFMFIKCHFPLFSLSKITSSLLASTKSPTL